MNLEKLDRKLATSFGFTGLYPEAGRDALIGIPVIFGVCVLIAFAAESHPAIQLKHAAIVSLLVVVVGLLLAKNRAVILCTAAMFVGARSVIVAVAGHWQGLIVLFAAVAVILLCRRWLP